MPATTEQARAVAERIFEFLPGSRLPTVEEVALVNKKLDDVSGSEGRNLRKMQVKAKRHVDAKPISAEQKEDFIHRLIPYICQAPENKVYGVEYSSAHFDTLAILNSMGLEGDALVEQTPWLRTTKVFISPEGKVAFGEEIILDPANTTDEWHKDPRNSSGYRANILLGKQE